MARTARTAAERNIPGSKGGRGVGQRRRQQVPLGQRPGAKMRVANTREARQAFQERVLEDVPTFPINVRLPRAIAYRNPRSGTYQVVDTLTNTGGLSTRGGVKSVNISNTPGAPSVNVPTSNINLSRFSSADQRRRAVQFFE